MSYSDYGGYAYRCGVRIEERSDCTIKPDGSLLGTPGCYPGFAAIAGGATQEEALDFVELPNGHAVLGDGPIYVVLHKQQTFTIYRGPERLRHVAMIRVAYPDVPVGKYDHESDCGRYFSFDPHYFLENDQPCELMADGCTITIRWTEEDNFYIYARLEQPDGTLWHGWSGYGVGAGLEDCGYGYSTSERERKLLEFWPDAVR